MFRLIDERSGVTLWPRSYLRTRMREEDDLVVDGEEDATFARPDRTKEALPGPDGIAESSQDGLV
jgi:hypothetical protein